MRHPRYQPTLLSILQVPQHWVLWIILATVCAASVSHYCTVLSRVRASSTVFGASLCHGAEKKIPVAAGPPRALFVVRIGVAPDVICFSYRRLPGCLPFGLPVTLLDPTRKTYLSLSKHHPQPLRPIILRAGSSFVVLLIFGSDPCSLAQGP